MIREEMEEVPDGAGAYTRCPDCGTRHVSTNPSEMDMFIHCDCGRSFYAFASRGLRITMPSAEARWEPIARALRRFVAATGRGQKIRPELYADPVFRKRDFRDTDAVRELAAALERYQNEKYGEILITLGTVHAVFEAIQNGNDVEFRRQKSGVGVFQVSKKKLNAPEKHCAVKPTGTAGEDTGASTQEWLPQGGILTSVQAQKPYPAQ